MRELLKTIVSAGPARGPRANAALLLGLGAGAVFLAFGAAKFVSHGSEVASFRTYGLPVPDAFVYAIGVVEIASGALLVLGRTTRLAGMVMSADMTGAIIVSGIGRGETISLTLAPVLLVTMLFLVWSGPGRLTIDRGLETHRRRLAARDCELGSDES